MHPADRLRRRLMQALAPLRRDMSITKEIVDTLSAAASFIAISTVLYNWYRSSLKPLSIEKITILRRKEFDTYIVTLKNRKDFPVDINKISCYQEKTFRVEKSRDKDLELQTALSSDHLLYHGYTLEHHNHSSNQTSDFSVEPKGQRQIRINLEVAREKQSDKYLHILHTTHGVQELWCKNVEIIPINDDVELSVLEYKFESNSEFKAKSVFYYRRLLLPHLKKTRTSLAVFITRIESKATGLLVKAKEILKTASVKIGKLTRKSR